MMALVGHDNYVRSALVAAILRSDGSAAKRLRKAAQEKGVLIDATSGNKTRSVLVLSSGQVVLCSLQPETVCKRFKGLSKEIEAGTVVPDDWS